MLVSICLTLLNNCMKKMIPELVEDSLVVVIQLSFLHITLKCVVELLDTKKDQQMLLIHVDQRISISSMLMVSVYQEAILQNMFGHLWQLYRKIHSILLAIMCVLVLLITQ